MAKVGKDIRRFARRLRSAPSEAERRLWAVLRERQLGGWRFRRQHPVPPYIADFACLEARLIVEADGEHHRDRTAEDTRRDAHLRRYGWRVLRFANRDILTNPEGVAIAILEALGERTDR